MLEKIPKWKNELDKSNNTALNKFSSSFVVINDIVEKINNTLNEDVPIQLNEGNIIKTGFNSKLDDLRSILNGGKDWIRKFQDTARKQLGI